MESGGAAGLLDASKLLLQGLGHSGPAPQLDGHTKESLQQLQSQLALLLGVADSKGGATALKSTMNGHAAAAVGTKRSRSEEALQYSLSKLPASVLTTIASYLVWADHPGFFEKDAWGPFRKMVLLSRDIRAAATSNILWRPACLRRWPWVEAEDEAARYVRGSDPDQRWFNMFVLMRRTASGVDRGYRFNWVSDIEVNVHMVDIKRAVNLCSVPGPLSIDHAWTRSTDSFFCSFHPVLGDDKGRFSEKLMALLSLPADKLYSVDEDPQTDPASQLSEYLTWAWSTTHLRVEVRVLDRVSGRVATLFASECLEDRLLNIELAPKREGDPASLHSRFAVTTGILSLGDPRFFVRFNYNVSLLLPEGASQPAAAAEAPANPQPLAADLPPESPGRPIRARAEGPGASNAESMKICEPLAPTQAPPVVVFDSFGVECGVSDPLLCQPHMTSSRLAFSLVRSLAWTGVGANMSFGR